MTYAKNDINDEERLDAIAEILARGYLRLLLSEKENIQDNHLKRLDNSKIASVNCECG